MGCLVIEWRKPVMKRTERLLGGRGRSARAWWRTLNLLSFSITQWLSVATAFKVTDGDKNPCWNACIYPRCVDELPPQVHLELTCPGTILFPNMGGDPICSCLTVFISFPWVTQQEAPIHPLCLTFLPGLSGSVCVYVRSWRCDGVLLHPRGNRSLPFVILCSVNHYSPYQWSAAVALWIIITWHVFILCPAHVKGDTGKCSGPPEPEVLLTEYLAFVF